MRPSCVPYALALLTVFMSCTDRPGSAVNTPNSGGVSGPTTEYRAASAGEEIVDSLFGLTLVAPFSDCTIAVTPVLTPAADMPAAPHNASMFTLRCSGADTLCIRIPYDSGAFAAVMTYGPLTGASTNDSTPQTLRWFSLPALRTAADSLAVTLPLYPASALAKKGARIPAGWPGFSHFAIVRAPAGSALAVTTAELTRRIDQAIGIWLDSLPASLRPVVARMCSTTHRCFISFDGNYYQGLWNILGIRSPRCKLSVTTTATEGNIAHEVGHYMSHLLAGDNRYALIGDRAPDDPHGLADVHDGRSTVTEDYAYFSEFFLTGKVNGTTPLTDPRSVLGTKSPASVDYPSIEGFGAALLASLVRQTDTIRDFSGVFRAVPRMGMSFADVADIFARGAASGDELYDAVYNKVTAVKAERLAINAEALGWSYRISGTLMDSLTRKGVGGAAVQSVAVTDENRFYTLDSGDSTNADGTFTVRRAFFGSSFLRCIKGGDTVDIPVTIDPRTPTTEIHNAGILYMPPVRISRVKPQAVCVGQYLWIYGSGMGAAGPDSITVAAMTLRRAVKPYYPLYGSDDSVFIWMPLAANPCSIAVWSGGFRSNSLVVTVRPETTMTVVRQGEIKDPDISERTIPFTFFCSLTGSGATLAGEIDSPMNIFLQCGMFAPSRLVMRATADRDTSRFTIVDTTDSSYTVYYPQPAAGRAPYINLGSNSAIVYNSSRNGDTVTVDFTIPDLTSTIHIDYYLTLPVRYERYAKNDSLLGSGDFDPSTTGRCCLLYTSPSPRDS